MTEKVSAITNDGGAAELAGLQVGDVTLPPPSVNPNAPAKSGAVRVQRTITWVGDEPLVVAPKTKGSRRTVPLTPTTTAMLRDYFKVHPRADKPTDPLFPNVRLEPPRPTGVRADNDDLAARRQAAALADLTVNEAGQRLLLDWILPVRHATFYKAVFRPALLRGIRVTPSANLSPATKFHGLRHTYASLCIAAGRPPLEVARFMGHAKVTTTLGVYAHLYADDHTDAMAALGAMEVEPDYGPNVIPLRG
jgi:integrase